MKIKKILYFSSYTLFLLITSVYTSKSKGIIPVSSEKYYFKIHLPNKALKPDNISIATNSENKNLIKWEYQPNASIDHYKIYRKFYNSSSNWLCIANVNYKDGSTYLDVSSVPAYTSYSYQISAIDLCGNELKNDSIFNSIHLIYNEIDDKTMNLSWNCYTGVKIGTYYVIAGDKQNNLTIIDSIASTNKVLYEKTLYKKYNYYKIIAKRLSQIPEAINNNNEISSNLLSCSINTLTNETKCSIFQYKENGKIYFYIPIANTTNYTVYVYDINGALILEQFLNSEIFEIQTEKYKTGIYLLQIKGKTEICTLKFIL